MNSTHIYESGPGQAQGPVPESTMSTREHIDQSDPATEHKDSVSVNSVIESYENKSQIAPLRSPNVGLIPLKEHIHERERRTVKLSEKAQDIYKTKVQEHSAKLRSIHRYIDSIMADFATRPRNDLRFVSQVQQDLIDVSRDYAQESDLFRQYLARTNSTDSQREMVSQDIIRHKTAERVVTILEESNVILHQSEVKENRKASPTAGSQSRTSLAKQRANAEAAKTSLEYEKRVIQMLKEKARIEEEEIKLKAVSKRKKVELSAVLQLLGKEKDVAVAEAELKAYCKELDSRSPLTHISERVDSVNSTEEYVSRHFANRSRSEPKEESSLRVTAPEYESSLRVTAPEYESSLRVTAPAYILTAYEYIPLQNLPSVTATNFTYADFTFSHAPRDGINAVRADPRSVHNARCPNPPTKPPVPEPVLTVWTKHMMKRDLQIHRLSTFCDEPEGYLAWTASFTNVVKDLEVTPLEEMDILIKYLGTESRRHAESLRSANASDPQKGLSRIWERLDERYGAPELIESSLRKKLLNFPKLANNDSKLLYDLADLLSEVQSIKDQHRYSSLMALYDSSTGINPIVSKLPSFMQNKWTDRVITYKRRHGVLFPPLMPLSTSCVNSAAEPTTLALTMEAAQGSTGNLLTNQILRLTGLRG